MNSAGRPLVSVYREALIARHYAHRTIDTYEHWLRRFLRFHLLRHPREMGGPEINAFLTHLAVEERVSASTQNQALAAWLFLWVKDLDFAGKQLIIRGGKATRTASRCCPKTRWNHYRSTCKKSGVCIVWIWQWVFPQVTRWRNRDTGEQGRHHLDPSVIQRG